MEKPDAEYPVVRPFNIEAYQAENPATSLGSVDLFLQEHECLFADRRFRAPKWLVGRSPNVSTRYKILSAMTDSITFPGVDRSEIGLQAFAIV